MSRFRRYVVRLAVVLTTVAGVTVFAQQASAWASCAHGGNPSATECLDGTQSPTIYYGAYTEFHNLALAVNSSYTNAIHVNAEQWFYTKPDLSQWVEFGLRNGVDVNGTNSGYTWFWAEFDSAGNEHLHLFGSAAADGTNHSYEIVRSSLTNQFDVFLDFNFVDYSRYQPAGTGWRGFQTQMGLENSQNPPTVLTHTSTFDFNPLEYMGSDSVWHDFPYHVDNVDYPCNEFGVSPYYPNGECFSWTPYVSEWKAAKN